VGVDDQKWGNHGLKGERLGRQVIKVGRKSTRPRKEGAIKDPILLSRKPMERNNGSSPVRVHDGSKSARRSYSSRFGEGRLNLLAVSCQDEKRKGAKHI